MSLLSYNVYKAIIGQENSKSIKYAQSNWNPNKEMRATTKEWIREAKPVGSTLRKNQKAKAATIEAAIAAEKENNNNAFIILQCFVRQL